jgi:hypothetical protein
MAIIQSPITGHMKKQAGGMVFSTVFGNKVMRAKPFQYRDKNSQAQQLQRAHMATVAQMLAPISAYISSLYDGITIKKTPFSIALGSTLKRAFPSPSFAFNPSLVYFGNEKGSMVKNVVLTQNINHNAYITWDKNTNDPDEEYAQLDVLFINESTFEPLLFIGGPNRSSQSWTYQQPASWVDAQVSGYIITTDFTSNLKRKPRRVVKFKAGNDLASKVR